MSDELSASQKRQMRKLQNPLAQYRKEEQELRMPVKRSRGGLKAGAAMKHPRQKKGKYYAA